MLIMKRQEAVEQGRLDYFTGVPCGRGHISPRWVRSGRCRACALEDTEKYRKEGRTPQKKFPYKLLPTQKYLSECFIYDNGLLVWRKDRPREHFTSDRGYNIYLNRQAGRVAGHQHKINKYTEVRINSKLYRSSRVIYKMFYNFDENLQIDHMNRDPSDNRIENLRVLSHVENNMNRWNTRDKDNGFYVKAVNFEN